MELSRQRGWAPTSSAALGLAALASSPSGTPAPTFCTLFIGGATKSGKLGLSFSHFGSVRIASGT